MVQELQGHPPYSTGRGPAQKAGVHQKKSEEVQTVERENSR